MPKDAPFTVELPEAGRDKPGFVKVSVIAAVGFVLGIAWPRVMGVKLGISAPGENAPAAASAASAHGGRAPEPNAASIVTKGPAAAAAPAETAVAPVVSAAPAPAAAAPGSLSISVHKGSVLSCKTADGDTKKGKECGSIAAIDSFIAPRLRKLGSCAGMEGQTGKLSVVVGADFGANRYSFDVGKSSTVSKPEAVAACLQSAFKNNSLAGTAHEYPRYTIAYSAQLSTGGAASDGAEGARGDRAEPESRSERGAKEAPADKADKGDKEEKTERAEVGSLASGEAKVAWEVALVRDLPKTGNLVTRLPRGTKVKVGPTKDGWYQVKFGDGFANEGWVYRGAIGR